MHQMIAISVVDVAVAAVARYGLDVLVEQSCPLSSRPGTARVPYAPERSRS